MLPVASTSICFLLVPWSSLNGDWYVDIGAPGCATGDGSQAAPFCNIATAIAAATAGDTIHVAPGTYFENLSIGTDVTIRGTGGASGTVIDGSGADRVVYIQSAVAVTLQGLTIQNGLETPGAGIFSLGPLVIRDCVVRENEAFYPGNPPGGGRGGGLMISGADLSIVDSQFIGNRTRTTQQPSSGAGIRIDGPSVASIVGSDIHGNVGILTCRGVGLAVDDDVDLVIEGSRITDNFSPGGLGGGVEFRGNNLVLRCSTISGNQAGFRGGGIAVSAAESAVIESTTISGNAAGSGGGLAAEYRLELRNSTISGNSGGGAWAYVYTYPGDEVLFDHATITENSGSTTQGDGLYMLALYPERVRVRNSIIAGNGSGPDVFAYTYYGASFESLGNNVIGVAEPGHGFTNGANGDLVGSVATPVDPLLGPLADNGGPTRTHELLPFSPAIDTADPVTFAPTDQRGLPRPAGSADVGAFERDPGGPIPNCAPVANSTGVAGTIAHAGTTSLASNDFVLTASSLPPGAFGFFLTSRDTGSVLPANSMGRLCLSGAIGRFVGPGQVLDSGSAGAFVLPLDLTQHPTPTGLVPVQPGETWFFQAWHRDSVMGAATSNFTGGEAATFR